MEELDHLITRIQQCDKVRRFFKRKSSNAIAPSEESRTSLSNRQSSTHTNPQINFPSLLNLNMVYNVLTHVTCHSSLPPFSPTLSEQSCLKFGPIQKLNQRLRTKNTYYLFLSNTTLILTSSPKIRKGISSAPPSSLLSPLSPTSPLASLSPPPAPSFLPISYYGPSDQEWKDYFFDTSFSYKRHYDIDNKFQIIDDYPSIAADDMKAYPYSISIKNAKYCSVFTFPNSEVQKHWISVLRYAVSIMLWKRYRNSEEGAVSNEDPIEKYDDDVILEGIETISDMPRFFYQSPYPDYLDWNEKKKGKNPSTGLQRRSRAGRARKVSIGSSTARWKRKSMSISRLSDKKRNSSVSYNSSHRRKSNRVSSHFYVSNRSGDDAGRSQASESLVGSDGEWERESLTHGVGNAGEAWKRDRRRRSTKERDISVSFLVHQDAAKTIDAAFSERGNSPGKKVSYLDQSENGVVCDDVVFPTARDIFPPLCPVFSFPLRKREHFVTNLPAEEEKLEEEDGDENENKEQQDQEDREEREAKEREEKEEREKKEKVKEQQRISKIIRNEQRNQKHKKEILKIAHSVIRNTPFSLLSSLSSQFLPSAVESEENLSTPKEDEDHKTSSSEEEHLPRQAPKSRISKFSFITNKKKKNASIELPDTQQSLTKPLQSCISLLLPHIHDAVDEWGNTLLHYAVILNESRLVKIVLLLISQKEAYAESNLTSNEKSKKTQAGDSLSQNVNRVDLFIDKCYEENPIKIHYSHTKFYKLSFSCGIDERKVKSFYAKRKNQFYFNKLSSTETLQSSSTNLLNDVLQANLSQSFSVLPLDKQSVDTANSCGEISSQIMEYHQNQLVSKASMESSGTIAKKRASFVDEVTEESAGTMNRSGNDKAAESLDWSMPMDESDDYSEPKAILFNKWGDTPLITAIKNGNLDICKLLLEMKANPNQINYFGLSPVRAACLPHLSEKTSLELLVVLKKYTRNFVSSSVINSRIAYVKTLNTPPLIECVLDGDLVATKRLLTIGADPNIESRDSKHRITSLHIACNIGCKDMVELLLRFGASANKSTLDGFKPIHYARNRVDIVELLLLYGAKTDVESLSTPLHIEKEDRNETLRSNGVLQLPQLSERTLSEENNNIEALANEREAKPSNSLKLFTSKLTKMFDLRSNVSKKTDAKTEGGKTAETGGNTKKVDTGKMEEKRREERKGEEKYGASKRTLFDEKILEDESFEDLKTLKEQLTAYRILHPRHLTPMVLNKLQKAIIRFRTRDHHLFTQKNTTNEALPFWCRRFLDQDTDERACYSCQGPFVPSYSSSLALPVHKNRIKIICELCKHAVCESCSTKTIFLSHMPSPLHTPNVIMSRTPSLSLSPYLPYASSVPLSPMSPPKILHKSSRALPPFGTPVISSEGLYDHAVYDSERSHLTDDLCLTSPRITLKTDLGVFEDPYTSSPSPLDAVSRDLENIGTVKPSPTSGAESSREIGLPISMMFDVHALGTTKSPEENSGHLLLPSGLRDENYMRKVSGSSSIHNSISFFSPRRHLSRLKIWEGKEGEAETNKHIVSFSTPNKQGNVDFDCMTVEEPMSGDNIEGEKPRSEKVGETSNRRRSCERDDGDRDRRASVCDCCFNFSCYYYINPEMIELGGVTIDKEAIFGAESLNEYVGTWNTQYQMYFSGTFEDTVNEMRLPNRVISPRRTESILSGTSMQDFILRGPSISHVSPPSSPHTLVGSNGSPLNFLSSKEIDNRIKGVDISEKKEEYKKEGLGIRGVSSSKGGLRGIVSMLSSAKKAFRDNTIGSTSTREDNTPRLTTVRCSDEVGGVSQGESLVAPVGSSSYATKSGDGKGGVEDKIDVTLMTQLAQQKLQENEMLLKKNIHSSQKLLEMVRELTKNTEKMAK